MIDPKHYCWWSARHRTDLSAAGTRFTGAGVSLPVLLRAFVRKNLSWYSLVYGDFDDNVLLLGVGEETASSFANRIYPEHGPMQRASSRSHFVEYELTRDVQSALGVTIDDNAYRIEHGDAIQQQIYVHDDCFFAIEPAGAEDVRELICSVLEQHSFYLGSDVHWDGILDETVDLLKRVEKVSMRSHPAQQRLTLSWNDRSSSRLKRAFGLRTSRRIEIQNRQAKYTDHEKEEK